MKNFETYLMYECMKENAVPDDGSVDFFENWINNLSIDDWLIFGDRYGKLCKEAKKWKKDISYI